MSKTVPRFGVALVSFVTGGLSQFSGHRPSVDNQGAPLRGGDGAAGFEVAWVREGVEVRRPLADVAGVAFEEVAPTRELPSYRGQRNCPGMYWSAATRDHVIYESRLELARRRQLLFADFDPLVHGVVAWPFLLKPVVEGRIRKHTPDYSLLTHTGQWWRK